MAANAGLDFSATLSRDGARVIVFAVNDSLHELARTMDFSDFGNPAQPVSVTTLTDQKHAGEPDVTNSFADPERVKPAAASFKAASARFTHRFPPLSLTVLEWRGTP